MKNIKLIIQYDGTRYKGFQKQNQKGNNVVTIQGKLENVLSKMTNETIEVIGCGRTDSGVHAENYTANFFTNSEMSLEKMREYLLEYLPEDIVVKELSLASERFHSRLNAKEKTYIYSIQNTKYIDVFNKKYSYHIEKKLNINEMNKGAQYLVGTHDFKSFTNLKVKNEKRSTVRCINEIRVIEEKGGLVQIKINGNGFLLNMVRIIAGTLIEVGLGVRSPESIKETLEALDKDKAARKAPAKGLILMEVQY